MEKKPSKALRNIAIILMGLTTFMNLVGGIGTVCAAFILEHQETLGVVGYGWLYKIFMITTILIGIAGVWMVVKMAKGGDKVLRNALIILGLGTLVGGVHYFSSMSIRGAGAPANMKFYFNAATLVVFILFTLPGIRERLDFSQKGGDSEAMGGGIAAIVSGLLTLTTFAWAGPSHTFHGHNWVDDLDLAVIFLGVSLLVIGAGLVGWAVKNSLVAFSQVVESKKIEH
jgi:hypothetical protein